MDRCGSAKNKNAYICPDETGCCGDTAAFLRFRSAAERIYMDNRIAMVSIIVDNGDSVARLNEVLHEYSDHIIGRMGIPYREAGLNLISIAACAPVDRINALTGRLGRLPGVSAKAVYAPAKRRDEE